MVKGISINTAFEDDEFEIFGSGRDASTPERRLLAAMLERAILDYVGNDPREVAEAETWIFGELSESKLREFSFPWVCQHLDLQAQEIAKIIQEMPKRGSKKMAPWYFEEYQLNKGVRASPEEQLDDRRSISTSIEHTKIESAVMESGRASIPARYSRSSAKLSLVA